MGRRLGRGGGEASLSSTLSASGTWNDARFPVLAGPYLLGLSAGLAVTGDDVAVGAARSGSDPRPASRLKLSLRSDVLLNLPMARARASSAPPPPSPPSFELSSESSSSSPPPKFPNPDWGGGLLPRFLAGGGLDPRIAEAIEFLPSSLSIVDWLKLVILRTSNIPSARLSLLFSTLSFFLGLTGDLFDFFFELATELSSTSLDTPPFRSPTECIRLRACSLRVGAGPTSATVPSDPTLNVSLPGSELDRFPLDGRFFFFFFFLTAVPPSASDADWLCSDTPSDVELFRAFFFFFFFFVPPPSSRAAIRADASVTSVGLSSAMVRFCVVLC